jgi:hypothetical protein
MFSYMVMFAAGVSGSLGMVSAKGLGALGSKGNPGFRRLPAVLTCLTKSSIVGKRLAIFVPLPYGVVAG